MPYQNRYYCPGPSSVVGVGHTALASSEADEPSAMKRHKINGLWCCEFGCHDEVALVLAILVIHQDDHAPVSDFGNCRLDAAILSLSSLEMNPAFLSNLTPIRELRSGCSSRCSTYFRSDPPQGLPANHEMYHALRVGSNYQSRADQSVDRQAPRRVYQISANVQAPQNSGRSPQSVAYWRLPVSTCPT